MDKAKIDIRKIEKSDLESFILSQDYPKYRSNQIWEWIWKNKKIDFQSMRTLPKDLKSSLEDHFFFAPCTIDQKQVSIDGTIKSRIRLHDDHLIESVLIPVPEQRRFTACVSSQVGCSLTCSFCATGKMKLRRNLDPAEIYDQVVMVNQQSLEHFGHPLTNIVYMGMGEPLLNYKNVLKSIRHINSEVGLGMSHRRITISTVGIAKMIKKLADDEVKFNLALSLHAADDTKRDKIMPINESNNLQALMEALTYFYQKTKNRISYEYISFKGFNDTEQDARNLLKMTKFFPVRVNIIEYNPIDGVNFERNTVQGVENFAKLLSENGVTVTIRKSRGLDIDAACGQLANKGDDKTI